MFNRIFRAILNRNKNNIIYNRIKNMYNYFNDDVFETQLGDRRVAISEALYPYTTLSLTYYDKEDNKLFGIACDVDDYCFIAYKNISEQDAKLALYELENILGIN